ncbi:MAG: PSD1 and planctomycete cytochrome C domain-containing protein [Planctomycetota bacterium]
MLASLFLVMLQSPSAPDFAREVRPILARACFKCHGPDEGARKGKLRLDESALARLGGRSGNPAIVPGKPGNSPLVARLDAKGAQRMPPRSSGLELSAKEKAILRDWVASGAEYQRHWAFVAPVKPALPPVRQADWCRNPIDRFVLARLEAAGLKPSHEANRYTLIRRLSFDLTGLPPTPGESDAFVADERPDAFARLVDRLLAHPGYGERWARKWLDLARYADTNGYEKDRPRTIWPWRDWVIGAYRGDLPYDQFGIQQLAGDMLPGATREQVVATGFHRNTMLNEEGGIDPLEFRYHAVADRVNTTGTAFLGLTLGCAQCHTHKYDPVSHVDYFRFMAFLDNAEEPELELPPEGAADKAAEARRKVAELEKALPGRFPNNGFDAAFQAWLQRERARAAARVPLVPTKLSSNLPRLRHEGDGVVFADGDATKNDIYNLEGGGSFPGMTELRVEALPDDRLPAGGPGLSYYEGPKGDFLLTRISLEIDGKPVAFTRATQTAGSSAMLALDDNLQTGWGVPGQPGRRNAATFFTDKPMPAGTTWKVVLEFGRHYVASLGKLRLTVAPPAHKDAPPLMPAEVENALASKDAPAGKALDALRAHFAATCPELANARREIDAARASVTKGPFTLVMRERPADNPRPTMRRHRGEYLEPREVVSAGVPGFLPALPAGAVTNRLEFARWLFSADNPLTARVAVNRMWAALFGKGIVSTPADFGLQGAFPSHPELLDWLAVTFRERGWSQKELLREIVTSATYRQASDPRADLSAKDPSNILLGRAGRFRLDAEMLRDGALKAAGLLSEKSGGPGVFPPQPANITTEGTYGPLAWKVSEGEDRYRRTIYTFTKRTAPFAFQATFDAPSGEACVARRESSNTALQSLTLLNDAMYLDAARALGRLGARQADDSAAITLMFRRVLTRPPTPADSALCLSFLQAEQKRLAASPADSKALAGGESDARCAALASLARVLLNLDEAVTRP